MSAALALHEFTLAELASFSGVKLATVRGVKGRQEHYFEELGAVATNQRGGQPSRFRFRDEHREKVEADFRSISGVKEIAAPSMAKPPSLEKHFEVAFDSAQNSLDAMLAAKNERERESLKRALPTMMRAVKSAVALSKGTPGHADLQGRFMELEARLPPNTRAPLAQPREWISTGSLRSWINDWTNHLQIVVDGARARGEEQPARDMYDRLMNRDEWLDLSADNLLAPAVGLATRLNGAASRIEARRGVAERLSEDGILENSPKFAALVACAAVCGSRESLRPLLTAVTKPEFGTRLTEHERGIVLRSIARFARPGADEDPRNAAIISFVLLNGFKPSKQDFAALLPVTMRSDVPYGSHIVEDVARSLYGSASSTPALGAEEEGCLMRNLAAACTADRMQTLAGMVPGLVSEESGERFVAALANRDFGAVRLRGHDEFGFVLSPGVALLGADGLGGSYNTRLKVDSNSQQREILNRMILRDSATLRPRKSATAPFAGFKSFIGRLRERNQSTLAELCPV